MISDRKPAARVERKTSGHRNALGNVRGLLFMHILPMIHTALSESDDDILFFQIKPV